MCHVRWHVGFEWTNLLQELNFGFEHLLHLVDFLLSLLKTSLQLCLIVIGQAFGCCAVWQEQFKKSDVEERVSALQYHGDFGKSQDTTWCHHFAVCYSTRGTPNTRPLIINQTACPSVPVLIITVNVFDVIIVWMYWEAWCSSSLDALHFVYGIKLWMIFIILDEEFLTQAPSLYILLSAPHTLHDSSVCVIPSDSNCAGICLYHLAAQQH